MAKTSVTKPDLLLVVPCLRAIFDNDDNLASVIDIMQEINISTSEVEAAQKAGADTLQAVFNWNVLTIWKRTQDKVATFIQTLEIVDPKGKKIQSTELEFATTHRTNRIRIRSRGFRVTSAGEYLVKVFIRPASGKRRTEAGRYPINVKFAETSE